MDRNFESPRDAVGSPPSRWFPEAALERHAGIPVKELTSDVAMMMRGLPKGTLLQGFGAVVALTILILATSRLTEPHPQGRALSVWVELAGLSEWQKGMYFRAGIPPAVQIAPSVVLEWRAQAEPILLRMIAARDPVWTDAYGRLTSTGPELLRSRLPHITGALEKRKRALTAISRMGPLSPRLEAAVIQAARDPEPAVRFRAAMVLGFKGSGSLETLFAFERLRMDRAVVSQLKTDSGVVDFGPYFLPQSLAETIQALDAPFEVARHYAVLMLGKYGRESTLIAPHLLRALGDTSDMVKAAAAQTLGQIGPAASDALPGLRGLLSAPSQTIREAAHEAIKQIEIVLRPSNSLDSRETQQ